MVEKKKLPQWASAIIALAIVGIVSYLVIEAFLSVGSNSSPSPAPTATNSATPAVAQEDAATAQKDLTDLMDLSKKANLVTSYELSATQDTIYVGDVWYTQTVQFKKDFLGKVATLKQEAFGSHFFEVHDAYSNEKVAEVTAFSGSLEVYK